MHRKLMVLCEALLGAGSTLSTNTPAAPDEGGKQACGIIAACVSAGFVSGQY